MEKGSIVWRSPSNIALVKYWGKYDLQLPMNPSISFTLDQCHTVTELRYEKYKGKHEEFVFKTIELNSEIEKFEFNNVSMPT